MMAEEPGATLTWDMFFLGLQKLKEQPVTPWVVTMHPNHYRQILWYHRRPEMRRVYREAGYPFGRNQGAFKNWVLLNGRLDG